MTDVIRTSKESHFKALAKEFIKADEQQNGSLPVNLQIAINQFARWLDEHSSNETKACVWEDCDQEAVYCPGHAREFVRGEPTPSKAEVCGSHGERSVIGCELPKGHPGLCDYEDPRADWEKESPSEGKEELR